VKLLGDLRDVKSGLSMLLLAIAVYVGHILLICNQKEG
jgi:hypothetical protein